MVGLSTLESKHQSAVASSEGDQVIIAVALAAFLIGFNKGGVAGTLGPFVTVLLVLTIPADDAVGLLLPMLIVADGFALAAHWRQWDVGIYVRLLIAAVIGIALGSLVISTVSETVLRRLIAVAMLAFAALHTWSRSVRLNPERLSAVAWPAGATAGLVSTIAHLGGPPVFVYLMAANLNPRRFVATSAVLFASINLLKVPSYFLAGLFDGELIVATVWAWVMIPAGVLAGRALVGKINRLWFERVTTLLLAAGAVLLLFV